MAVNMKTVEEIYLAIAENINNSIKENWKVAVLELEVLDGMVSNTGTYENDSNEKKQIDVDEFDFELTFDILELHKIMTEGNSNRWNKAVFNLTTEGKFDIEFIWDQELNDEIERLNK